MYSLIWVCEEDGDFFSDYEEFKTKKEALDFKHSKLEDAIEVYLIEGKAVDRWEKYDEID